MDGTATRVIVQGVLESMQRAGGVIVELPKSSGSRRALHVDAFSRFRKGLGATNRLGYQSVQEILEIEAPDRTLQMLRPGTEIIGNGKRRRRLQQVLAGMFA